MRGCEATSPEADQPWRRLTVVPTGSLCVVTVFLPHYFYALVNDRTLTHYLLLRKFKLLHIS